MSSLGELLKSPDDILLAQENVQTKIQTTLIIYRPIADSGANVQPLNERGNVPDACANALWALAKAAERVLFRRAQFERRVFNLALNR